MNSYAPFATQSSESVNRPSYLAQQPKKIPASNKWQVAPQTKIAFIGFVLLVLSMVISMIQNPKLGSQFVINLVVNIASFVLALYVINCTVLGKCNMYAWIISYVAVVLGIISIVGLILALAR
jgi:hypothetical protein